MFSKLSVGSSIKCQLSDRLAFGANLKWQYLQLVWEEQADNILFNTVESKHQNWVKYEAEWNTEEAEC